MDTGFAGLLDSDFGYEGDLHRNDEEVQRVIDDAILRLPTLEKHQVPMDDTCGICLQTFSAIINDTSQNEGELELANGQKVHLDGVTRLEDCGHVFCKLDLVEWIKGSHGTCPACRHQFLEIPIAPEQDESVDEDYVPEEDDFESDGFTDVDDWELEPDEMDLDEDLDEEVAVERCVLEMYARSTGDETHRMQEEEEVCEEAENPGLSDSLGSEGLSDEEVLAGMSADEGVSSALDNAVIVSGETRVKDPMRIGSTSSTQAK